MATIVYANCLVQTTVLKARLAALAAAGDLGLEVRSITVDEGPVTAGLVATGRSGGVKFVIEFVDASPEQTSVG